ncbi:hypothetical protein B0T25DRAFT_589702 [Lasiosphaeria hispida]|uniref:Protein HOS4 n=1 Tax=Lasiosphaeria hispida TaxID=260671 RepID=A0AAJ0HMD6_9PEZI|nr:hypothetical protein B0T25DRAFT_589702 [Lasiosphaeria hispida]
MDAQNAVEPASSKPAASPKRPGSDSDQPRPSATARTTSNAKPEPPPRDRRPSTTVSHHNNDDDAATEGNSDAETIVLPGKDGHSPSKVRKIIKREDRSDGEDPPSLSRGRKQDSNGKQDRDVDKGDRRERKDKSVSAADNRQSDRAPSLGVKKKKLVEKPKAKDGSSGLSSAPASPPQRRRRSSNTHSKSDSETAQVESPRTSSKEKPKSADKLIPHKRKAPRLDSDDEGENRKTRRPRYSGSGLDASRKPHPPAKQHGDTHSSTRTRSVSPQPRPHRRTFSSQLPGQYNGLSHKKKRVPAPLQTDYHSDESSASGSPHPRSSKLRSLTTPATTESTVSPAKLAPHKKHLDAHGQTFLARACAKGEYETAKQRLQERPEDINVADYAGNTPLQISALNGFDDIVKLLVDAGCNLECVNNDKDTPLLDAVENGHLEVVKILLAAGVNPRKANAYGQEPIDRVTDDLDHAEEIKRALQDAKQRMGERRRTSEDHHLDHTDARSSHGPESPRRSPGAAGSIHAASGRRAGTVRSNKTSNHLLYMPMDDKTLRAAAARGDEETVIRILQVRDKFDDPESMVAAARGGHDIVMQLLLALGKANPDPAPIANNDYSTPMLAAIGQENIKVVRLLLDQADFDPLRRYKGEAYHEIARRRRGPNWIEEEQMLKDAYDKKSHRDGSKTKSPNRREQDRESRRSRAEPKDEASRSHKRKASSPTRESKRTGSAKISTSPKEKRRSNSITTHPEDQTSPRRGPGRPKKEDRIPTIAISDREASPIVKPTAKAKRIEPDLAAASSEGETVKPRRKLVSGRELKGEREKIHRRASMTSNASSLKEPSSPREESEKAQKTEKYHDRTKALKRDDSRDRLSVSGESSGKRHRSSATPPHLGSSEKDAGEVPAKRRRLDVEGKERRLKTSSSDDRHLKTPALRDPASTTVPVSRTGSKSRDDEDRRLAPKPKKAVTPNDHGRRESGKSISSESSIHVKSEDQDVDMPDAAQPAPRSESDVHLQKAKEAEEKKADERRKKKQAEAEADARAQALAQALEDKKEEERKRKEEEEKEKESERIRLEEEAKRHLEAEAEARRREEEEREKKRQEDEERKRKEEEDRKQRELEERRQREEEERRRLEEENKRKEEEEKERKRKEELEKKRKEEEERRQREEEERKRKEEEEKRREEEERLRKEQLEREAAEESRRKREEEERKERERILREEMERRKAAKEAERAARDAEQRRIRLAKLPPVLRWLDGSVNPKIPEVAEKFRIIQGVRYDCIRPEATGTAEGREQWLLNTQVALLLGEKDLDLSRYTAWEQIPASYVAKRIIWRLESDRFALTLPNLYELGKQIPEYYGDVEPERMSYRVTEGLRADAWKKFVQMDTFFVKASDFMYIVPTIPHLRSLRLTMEYRELPEDESLLNKWTPLQKWKSDPDANRNYGFAPGNKHFTNGELISEDRPGLGAVSTTPFPEKRVPRRGLVAVFPDDPAYSALCKEQGLDHLLGDADSPLLPNGIRSSPVAANVNGGLRSPSSLVAAATTNNTSASTSNGQSHGNQPISPSSESGPAQARPLVNGANGSTE